MHVQSEGPWVCVQYQQRAVLAACSIRNMQYQQCGVSTACSISSVQHQQCAVSAACSISSVQHQQRAVSSACSISLVSASTWSLWIGVKCVPMLQQHLPYCPFCLFQHLIWQISCHLQLCVGMWQQHPNMNLANVCCVSDVIGHWSECGSHVFCFGLPTSKNVGHRNC